MENHPLFPEPSDRPNISRRRSRQKITKCSVIDYILGPVGVHETPHYFFARDIVCGFSAESSALLYILYRRKQFGFNEADSKIDLEYFRQKILNPRLDYSVSVERRGRSLVVQDGFHRLAIAAAHGQEWVWCERL